MVYINPDIQYIGVLDYYNDALYTAGKYQESLTLLTEIVHFNTYTLT